MSTVDIVKKMDEADQKVKDFSDLLESIETTADKKKLLWKFPENLDLTPWPKASSKSFLRKTLLSGTRARGDARITP